MWFRRRGIPLAGADPPFTIVNRRVGATAAGYFTPMAEVAFDHKLVTSGLLAKLSAADAKTLLAVLANVTANGRIAASVSQVGKALGVPAPIALARLVALSRRRWRGRPVLFRVDVNEGLAGYAPSPEIVGQRLGPLEREEENRTVYGAGREAVVKASRATYARPRQVVEAEIHRVNGGMLPEEVVAATAASNRRLSSLDAGEFHVVERLKKHGVDSSVAEDLVKRHGRAKVARQIAFLPFRRNVRNIAKVLVASIEEDFEPPASFPTIG